MFFSIIRSDDKQPVCIRKDAVRFVEPEGEGVLLHIDGVGVVRTETFDILGFTSIVAGVDVEDVLAEVA